MGKDLGAHQFFDCSIKYSLMFGNKYYVYRTWKESIGAKHLKWGGHECISVSIQYQYKY